MKTVFGRVVDEQNQPVQFAIAYVSNNTGLPTSSSRTAQADDNGRFKIENVNDDEFISVKYTGLIPQTKAVTSAIDFPAGDTGLVMPTLLYKMSTDPKAQLNEVVIKANKKRKLSTGGWALIITSVVLIAVVAFKK